MSAAFRYSFEDCFSIYLDNKREGKIDQVQQLLEKEYKDNHAITGESVDDHLPFQAMTESLFYQIFDESGKLVIDSKQLLEQMSYLRNDQQDNVFDFNNLHLNTEKRNLEVDGKTVGSMIAYFDIGYSAGEFQFQKRLNRYIVGAEIMMVTIGLIFALLFSKRLANGILKVRDAAKQLQSNDLSVQIPTNNLTEEVKQLAESFNDLAQSLRNQENLRKQFSIDLAHEFRTPIATLRSQIEAFQDGIWEPTPERLQQNHNELMRLVRLVDELEKLMAAENPEFHLNIEKLEVHKVLDSLNHYFQPRFQQKNITFLIEQPSSQHFFYADSDRFIQIMSNLLNNAQKYTPENGTISLSVNEINNTIKFTVKDNGVGISKDDLPHIFERFYRGEKSRNRNTGGVGIGLSIVKALVNQHHGNISITSELGKGTEVQISLPLNKIAKNSTV